MFYLVKAAFHPALELGEQLLRIAEHQQDASLLVGAHAMLGPTCYFAGEIRRAEEHLEQGRALYDAQQHPYPDWAGAHPGVQCCAYAGSVAWVRGYPDRAATRLEEAHALADSLSHPYSQAWVSLPTAQLHQSRGEIQLTLARAEAAFTFATERGFPMIWFWAQCLRGWALAASGQAKEGYELIREGVQSWLATGAEQTPYPLSLLATAYGRAVEPRKGLEVVTEALAAVDRTGERLYEAELYRLRGELTLQSQVQRPELHVTEAEECFQKAIDVARQQQGKSLELRAVTSLARLWQSQGKTTEACNLLAPVYNWFTEGFDTADLKDAKTLLEELS